MIEFRVHQKEIFLSASIFSIFHKVRGVVLVVGLCSRYTLTLVSEDSDTTRLWRIRHLHADCNPQTSRIFAIRIVLKNP